MSTKIVCIIDRLPAEGDKGYSQLAFQRIKFLINKNFNITLISFFDEKDAFDIKSKAKLEELGVSVEPIKRNKLEQIINIIKFPFFSKQPVQCLMVKSKDFNLKLKKILQNESSLIIYSVLSRISINLDQNIQNKIIVDFVDSMALNFKRRAKNTNFFMKLLFKIEMSRISIFEEKLANSSSASFVVSEIDKSFLNSKNVFINKLGTDLSAFYKEDNVEKTIDLIFTGNMNYQPNSEAIIWFIKNCFPDLLKKNKNIKLVIAGRNPSSKLLGLNETFKNNIHVVGYVRSMREIINKSKVAIVPMQSGSGMQNKILEAFAGGVPVISSLIGLGDIKAINGRDIIIADHPKDYINSILDLMKNPKKALGYGNNGLEYVNQNHDWDLINEKFLSKIDLDINK